MTQTPRLDLNALHMCNTGDIPDGLIKWAPGLTDTEKSQRLGMALHEAAHFAASCACHRSAILKVFIHPTGRSTKSYGGRVQSVEVLEEEEFFVTAAGIAWERLSGQEWRARSDIDLARHSTVADKRTLEDTASCFLVDHARVIWAVAVAFLASCRADGNLDGPKLKEIERWTRENVRSFAR